MPIEIKELVIRTVAGKGDAEWQEDAPSSAGSGAASPHDHGGTEEIVKECVHQILKILTRNKER